MIKKCQNRTKTTQIQRKMKKMTFSDEKVISYKQLLHLPTKPSSAHYNSKKVAALKIPLITKSL